MTVYEVATTTTSVLGLLAVIGSILLVRRQLGVMSDQTRRFTESLQISAESALDNQLLFVSQSYVDHPDLRSIFNEHEQIDKPKQLDRQLQLRANAVAEVLLDAMERGMRFESQELHSGSLLRSWTEDSIRGSSFLRAFLAEHRTWYSPELVALLSLSGTDTQPPGTRFESVADMSDAEGSTVA
jgi:hypothetical protein